MATTIGLGQLRNHACGYVEKVMAGETIDVVRRGNLVAKIVSIPSNPSMWSSTGLPTAAAAHHSGNRVGLAELRTRAGRLFDRVANGEIIEIAWRERVVARIVSVANHPKRPPIVYKSLRSAACVPGDRFELEQLPSTRCLFDRVAEGEMIDVLRRGTLIARIVPVTP